MVVPVSFGRTNGVTRKTMQNTLIIANVCSSVICINHVSFARFRGGVLVDGPSETFVF